MRNYEVWLDPDIDEVTKLSVEAPNVEWAAETWASLRDARGHEPKIVHGNHATVAVRDIETQSLHRVRVTGKVVHSYSGVEIVPT